MGWPEPGIWDPGYGATGSTAETGGYVNVEVAVQGSEITGVVQIHITKGWSMEMIAARLAEEWNARKPIMLTSPGLFGEVYAVAVGNATEFHAAGDLAKEDGNGDPLHPVVRMGVTFPGQNRAPLNAHGASDTWNDGKVKFTWGAGGLPSSSSGTILQSKTAPVGA